MMKKFMIPALALVAASVAVPAAAQSYGSQHRDNDRYERHHDRNDYRGWQSITQRKYNLDRRIDQGLRNRSLSYREATRLKSQLNDLVRLERDYMRGGLSARERSELDRRYDRLSAQVREERRDHDGRRR